MENVSLSIIVPFYNKENYAERAFNSLILQKYVNLEILLIDDCSSDNTYEILSTLYNKYSGNHKIRLLQQKTNQGYGAAVNLGIKEAKGEFIAIFEPDDELPEYYYLILLQQILKDSAEVVFYDTYLEIRESLKTKTINMYNPCHLNTKKSFTLEEEEIQKRLCIGNVGICMGIYKKEFLIHNECFCNENSRGFEDIAFIAQVMQKVQKIKIVPGGGYKYTKDGLTQSTNVSSNIYKIIIVAKFVLDRLDKTNTRYPSMLGYLLNHLKTYYDRAAIIQNDFFKKEIWALSANIIKKQTIKCNHRVANFIKSIDKNCIVNVVDNYTPVTYAKTKPLAKMLDEDFSIIRSYGYLKFYLLTQEDIDTLPQSTIYNILGDIMVFANIPESSKDTEFKAFISYFLKHISINKIHKTISFNNFMVLVTSMGIAPLAPNHIQTHLDVCDEMTEIYQQTNDLKIKNINFFLIKTRNQTPLQEYLKNKSIAVVGNSPCEIGRNKGAEIDSHDVVIRFNNFSLDKDFIIDYGKKTNIWVLTPALNSILKRETLQEFDFILTPISNRIIPMDRFGVLNNWLQSGIKVVRIDCIDYLIHYDIRVMSLGLIVICYLLDKVQFSNLTLYGFSLKEQNQGVTHYFDGDPSKGKILSIHKWDKESQILKEICKILRGDNNA